VLLDAAAPAEAWAAALRQLWDDAGHYQLLSEAARAHSQRAANDPTLQTDQWETMLNYVARQS
jgi:hypothetical protein